MHRAPVLGKAVLLSSVAIAAFWFHSAVAFAFVGGLLGGLARLARLPQGLFWRSLRPLLLIAFFTLVAGAFFSATTATAWVPHLSLPGLQRGALYAARLLLITLLTTLFFLTTPPDEAISLGVRCLAPLRLLGIDSKELSLLVHLAYRFIPMLARELEEKRLSRLARNLTPPRGLARQTRQRADFLVSVVIGAIHRAEIAGLALEQRGILATWKPLPLAGGDVSGLLPLLFLNLCVALLLRFEGALL